MLLKNKRVYPIQLTKDNMPFMIYPGQIVELPDVFRDIYSNVLEEVNSEEKTFKDDKKIETINVDKITDSFNKIDEATADEPIIVKKKGPGRPRKIKE